MRNSRVRAIFGYQRQLEERTKKLQEMISEVEHISYAIVHDMRAPLRAMQGFATLLESRVRRTRSAGGTVASVTAHSALIAATVFATAQARVQKPAPPPAIRVDYFAPRPVAPPRTHTNERSAGGRVPNPIDIIFPGTRIPSIDLTILPSITDHLAPPIVAAATKPAGPGRDGSGGEATGAFDETEVEKAVALIAGSAAPRYPEVLRASGVEGRVLAVFVVDERGRAEVDSVRFVGVDNPLFEDAVRAALPRMRFVAAEIAGRKVRQLVQMPFVFTIDR
jgi:protein TonB